MNSSGYKGITKSKDKRYIQGFFWIFRIRIDGKPKAIKSCVDKEWLINYAEKWKQDHNYY